MLYHVTGAKGLVGLEVTKALAKLGEVHGTDIDDMDITDLDTVRKVLAERPPDVVVHLAGLKGNLPGRQQPIKFFGVNTTGVLNMLEASRLAGVKHFVFFSSMTAHGPGNTAFEETSPLNPQHPYSGSKAAAEFIVHAYSNAYGIRGTIFRPNFIVGSIPAPLPYVDNIIYDFIQALRDKGEVVLAGEGQYEREWMHPRDVASAVAAVVSSEGEGCETYILRGERVTMRELTERIIERVGKGTIATNPEMGGFSIISSGDKIQRQIGWKPRTSLDDLIDEIWNEYQSRL